MIKIQCAERLVMILTSSHSYSQGIPIFSTSKGNKNQFEKLTCLRLKLDFKTNIKNAITISLEEQCCR